MSWLVPSALGIAVGASLVALALHFIARSRPMAEPLPTARFVPDRPIHARARSVALTDIGLLLMRVAAILVLGLAVAGPMFSGRARTARIVLVDRSRAVGNASELRDSARAASRGADVVIPFDSSAAELPDGARVDSIGTTSARGSLSAALAAALSTAAHLPQAADSIELVIVSPFASEEIDEATARLRAAWPGRVRLARVAAASAQPAALRVETVAPSNDAVTAGLALMGVSAKEASVRVVRQRLSAADSLWARAAGHVLVHWPESDSSADWRMRSAIDAIGGVATSSGTLVARFPRVWVFQDAPAVARWSDGEPAAVEHATGEGCIRDVGILIDQASDVTLHEPFRRFVGALLAPCGGVWQSSLAAGPIVASLAGNGSLALASLLRDRASDSSPWTLWLLLLAALLLIGELALRRTRARVRAT